MRKFIFILLFQMNLYGFGAQAQTITCAPTWAKASFSQGDFYMLYTAVAFCDTSWVKSQFSNSDVYKLYTAQVCICRAGSGGGSVDTNNFWNVNGNAGTVAGTNYIGTSDNVSLSVKTNATERIRFLNTGAVGIGTTTPTANFHVLSNDSTVSTFAMKVVNNESASSGTGARLFQIYNNGNFWAGDSIEGNLFFGSNSGLVRTSSALNNLGFGVNTLKTLSSGTDNTAVGANALLVVTTAIGNTAVGSDALRKVTGANNVGIGLYAGDGITTGSGNIAIGYAAGGGTTGTGYNVSIGYGAGIGITTGSDNVCIGSGTGRLLANQSSAIHIGANAGYYSGTGNRLYIDALLRANDADQQAKAPIYGVIAATVAAQELWFNVGHVNLSGVLANGTFANNAAALAGGLVAGDTYYTDVTGEYFLKLAH